MATTDPDAMALQMRSLGSQFAERIVKVGGDSPIKRSAAQRTSAQLFGSVLLKPIADGLAFHLTKDEAKKFLQRALDAAIEELEEEA